MTRTLLVVGDSVPVGEGTDATPWPRRLPDLVDSLAGADVETRGGTGVTLAALAGDEDLLDPLAGRGTDPGSYPGLEPDPDRDRDPHRNPDRDPGSVGKKTAPEGGAGAIVLVHAGHNDAQVSGGAPRVPLPAFREAAASLDGRLAEAPAVARHAFVGLVPLLRLDRPGSVPFGEEQPGRSLDYDFGLAGAVADHVPVARPIEDWRDRTADGVHPDGSGHALLADRVVGWIRGEG